MLTVTELCSTVKVELKRRYYSGSWSLKAWSIAPLIAVVFILLRQSLTDTRLHSNITRINQGIYQRKRNSAAIKNMRKRCWNHLLLELLVNPKSGLRDSSDNQGGALNLLKPRRSRKSLIPKMGFLSGQKGRSHVCWPRIWTFQVIALQKGFFQNLIFVRILY